MTDLIGEIESPSSKKYEIMELFKEYTFEEHNNKEEKYRYLANTDEVIIIKNPNNKNDMVIEMSDEFTLFFANWHGHYDPFEEDYDEMIQMISDIINGNLCTMAAYCENHWLASGLYNKEINITSNQTNLLKLLLKDRKTIKKVFNKGGKLVVNYWNDSYLFEFEAKSELHDSYTFPKRQNTRFAVKGNRVYGSGGFIPYDEDMACLQYLYLEVQDDDLYAQLLKKIEEDVLIGGFTSIIAGIDNNNKSFYTKHGYQKEIKVDENKLTEIVGSQIDFDMILLKQFSESEHKD